MSSYYIIIGGSKGTGKELLRRLIKKKKKVIVVGRTKPDSKLFLSKNIIFLEADLNKTKQVSSLVSTIKSMRISISHIVFFQRYRGHNRHFSGEYNVSQKATDKIIRGLIDSFNENSLNKSIVLIGSIASEFVAMEQPVSYHIGKSSMREMAKYYAVALGPKNIRVNYLRPATILKEENKEFYVQDNYITKLFMSITPLNRLGTAVDIVNCIEFLCSKKASFITGIDLPIDGGVSLESPLSKCRRVINPNSKLS